MIVVLLAVLLISGPEPTSIESLCVREFIDAKFTAKVVSGDQAALKKIGRDFGQSYKFSSANVFLAEPFKLRIESQADGSQVLMVENGLTTIYTIPGTGIKRARDLTHSPGGRQTMVDFGILTPSLFKDVFDASLVSEDSSVATFDLTYKKSPEYEDASRFRVVVDKAKRILLKRDWYGQDGKLRGSFEYLAALKVGGLWVPSYMRVSNADGKLAGETKAVNIKVNTGLPDKLFQVK